MPTGKYKRTKYHKARQAEGWAKSSYVRTKKHNAKISAGIKRYWTNKKKGIKICSCCGKPYID